MRMLPLGLAALTVAAVMPTPARAAPTLCYAVSRDGTLPPPLSVGPVCVPFYEGPANCRTTVVDTTFLNVVTIYYCLPR
jgi:hypothetical protein